MGALQTKRKPEYSSRCGCVTTIPRACIRVHGVQPTVGVRVGWKYFVGGWSDNSAASHAMSTKPSTKRRAKEESNGDKKQRFYFKFPEHNSDFVWSQGAFSVIVKISQRFVYSSICHACWTLSSTEPSSSSPLS